MSGKIRGWEARNHETELGGDKWGVGRGDGSVGWSGVTVG